VLLCRIAAVTAVLQPDVLGRLLAAIYRLALVGVKLLCDVDDVRFRVVGRLDKVKDAPYIRRAILDASPVLRCEAEQ
jgi:hypothetical protein